MGDSLFHIATGLQRLMAQRQDLIAEFEELTTPEEQVPIGNAIEALEVQIKEQVRAEVRKVDGVRGYILHEEMLEQAAKAEKERQAASEKGHHDAVEHVKKLALFVMDEIGESRLQGKTGTIRAQNNGGLVPLAIPQPELVPDELVRYEGTWSANVWETMKTYRFHQLPGIKMTKVPDNAAIRAELEKSCAMCDGTGGCGCARPSCACHQSEKCPACGGTGKNAVPGAYLERRAKHVRIS